MIPGELKGAKRWILWKFEEGRKVPYSVKGFRASSMKPSNWTTYEAVRDEYADDPTAWAGLGFVLGDGYCGVDLDGCRDLTTGVIDEFATELIAECGSYWEVSPSGTGVKIFCTGEVPKAYKRPRDEPGKALEVYGGGRYFAVTDLGEAAPLAPIPERLLIVPEKEGEKIQDGDKPPQFEQARAAVLSLPDSIEHNGSHNALLQAVCEVMRWGMLDKYGMMIVKEYNQTKSFHEDGETPYPWLKDELLHKWRDAKKKVTAAGETGKRLHETQPSATVDEFGTLTTETTEKANGGEFGDLPATPATTAKKKVVLKYREYPIDALPVEMRAYVEAAAVTLSCTAAPLAVPFLVATGGVIGNKRWADLTGEWAVPPNLWAATICLPGTAKSSITKKAFRFLTAIEKRLNAEYLELWNDWNSNADKKKVSPPERRRMKVGDTTMEALISVYRLAPNGVVIDADELVGWVNGIGQYKQGQGSDKSHWLGFWEGTEVHYDRKTGEPAYIHLERPIVSLSGNIQPQVLADTIYQTGRDDGLLQRLLVCMPPAPGINKLHIGKIPDEITKPIADAYDRLFELQNELDDNLKDTKPVVMSVDDRALDLFCGYHLDLKIGAAALDDIYLRGHWNKLDTYTIRFAIILELFKWAVGRGSDKVISAESMESAIRITEWHQYESLRVYSFLATKSTNLKRK